MILLRILAANLLIGALSLGASAAAPKVSLKVTDSNGRTYITSTEMAYKYLKTKHEVFIVDEKLTLSVCIYAGSDAFQNLTGAPFIKAVLQRAVENIEIAENQERAEQVAQADKSIAKNVATIALLQQQTEQLAAQKAALLSGAPLAPAAPPKPTPPAIIRPSFYGGCNPHGNGH